MPQRRSETGCLFLPAAGSFQEAPWKPAVDVYRTPDGWLAKFDLAGIRLEDVHLKVEGRCLCVRGVRRDWCVERDCQSHSLEIIYSEFQRRIEFPVPVEGATIDIEYQAGMLLVRLQRQRGRHE
jgi:HSP20 family protein